MAGQKLELTWVGKNKPVKLEPRLLLEVPEKSYCAKTKREGDIFDNMLIHGDNLLALKALESKFTGQVKCVYIDPPYNTGSAFKHYDDCLEHSTWLNLMRARLESIFKLLKKEGVLFISIDDDECHYLKILCDEVFGRENFCGSFVWERKKKPSFLSNMGVVTEYILAYAKEKKSSPPFIYGTTTKGKKYPINNAGNTLATLTFPAGSVSFRMVDQVVVAQDMSGGNIVTRLLNDVIIKNGVNENQFSLEGEWRYSQDTINEIIDSGEQIVISKVPFRPNHVKDGGKPKKMKNLLSVAHYSMATNEDATAESEALFGNMDAFDNPKPEMLISTLIDAVTEKGDLVLDSFLGSGTTAAVAHKMGRRWIGVELGDHCYSHCISRLQKVIDGNDMGGVSKSYDWQGGGGFRFYELAPSLIKKDEYGIEVIDREHFDGARLIEAVCKIMGFEYAPSQDEYFIHGQSTENAFIYVTTNFMTTEHIRSISQKLGDRHLSILCKAFDAVPADCENITISKIPKEILDKCEWGHDDYSLNVKNLPMSETESEPSLNL
ncbi:putative type III restriction-modification system, Mod subunit [Fibrobacter succinogenes subsp. succinogenes S85]|uniref:site-specific DNA-methyltransferase (adenine-specific) n=1 Tax=Fibrobacter succinogenes (strain ATCC 19169 / S85) TaxID=59374 RepID=C9RS83_FIBSS|nr:site-specific DNA-methyltransferase [Fibrobacter succinogenes]ACX75419.1 DNA methylase N-4/N-6 domain protein [Fibrobacter succinogenes subsp. succinogenes S85]ADL25504.1 putative type III restriction-modification system, Mod subunit [Fibrobacter succinogenes subsp. succinogenes S85]